MFVGAWNEAAVIGRMLTTALDRFDGADYRLFVGVYPNDRATIEAVGQVAATHRHGNRVQAVSGPLDGPPKRSTGCGMRCFAPRKAKA